MLAMGGTECTLGIGEWTRYLMNAGVSFITYTVLLHLMWLYIPREYLNRVYNILSVFG